MRLVERPSGGFTLLELLVAMTLLGLLMTALFGGLRLGARVWEASDRVLDNESRTLVIRRFLHDRLEQALPARTRQTDGGGEVVFAGEKTTLRFASTMPDSLGFGPFVMELAMQPGSNRDAAHDLMLRWRAIDTNSENAASDVDERILVSGLSSLAFAYFGTKDGAGSAPAWHAAWEGQAGLPDLIRLDVGFGEDATADWPPLIVSPKVNAWHETTF